MSADWARGLDKSLDEPVRKGDAEVAALGAHVADKLPMLPYAPLVPTSALHATGLDEALDLAAEAARWRTVRVPRRRLNELFERAQALRPLPMVRAKERAQAGRIRILYVLQAYTETPTYVVHTNRHVELHPSQIGWIENTIRSQWAYTATPIRILLRSRDVRKRRRTRHTSPPRERHRPRASAIARGPDPQPDPHRDAGRARRRAS